MNKNTFKDTTFDLVASIAKAMGNAHRLEILELLANGPKSVEEIAQEVRISIANTSQHLQKLKQNKLVESHRQGTTIFYLLANDSVLVAIKSLHQTAYSQLPELKLTIDKFRKQYGTDKSTVKTLPQDDYVLLDVRSVKEYKHGHNHGAINIPSNHLSESLSRLDKNKLIVAYCRGELCTDADEVVRQLLEAGFKAVRLQEIVMMKSA